MVLRSGKKKYAAASISGLTAIDPTGRAVAQRTPAAAAIATAANNSELNTTAAASITPK